MCYLRLPNLRIDVIGKDVATTDSLSSTLLLLSPHCICRATTLMDNGIFRSEAEK